MNGVKRNWQVGAMSLLLTAAPLVRPAPMVREVPPGEKTLLPGGKEADGVVGDFVIRNDLVEAVITGNLPGRKANMSTYWDTTSPGCLIDLTLRGRQNDQLTIFSPSGQRGPLSFVRILRNGSDGEAAVEAFLGVARNRGLGVRHEYRLRDGWQGLLIETTLRNDATEERTFTPEDRWSNFTRSGVIGNIHWADAVNPADKVGYAFAWVESEGVSIPPPEVVLQPGETLRFARFVAVGRSPAEAFGVLAAMTGPTGVVEGLIQDADGQPLPHAVLRLKIGDQLLPAYPDDQGRFSFPLPLGEYQVEASEIGRGKQEETITVTAQAAVALSPVLDPASAIVFDIRDEAGRSLPCKAQFIGRGGTPSPNLGPANRAHGCLDQFHSETGQFRVQLPPGKYGVVITRGIEYSHLSESVELAKGDTQTVTGVLRRLVDTRGWVSADFHNHSTPSGDNTCGTEDRIINLAAEHIEFAPTTEHNRFFDWQPYIAKLGLSAFVSTVPGIELTGSGTHLNAFPFTPDPHTQDNGAPTWQKDPRVNAIVLRDYQGFEPDRWIQLNHPDMIDNFIDRDGDGLVDGGYVGLGPLVDGVETQNGLTAEILAGAPYQIRRNREGKEFVAYLREFIWLQMLNRGHRFWGVAVSDAHSVHGNGVGGWRMYLPSATDDPAQIDWRELSRHAKAGRSILTSGPFLEVMAADGTGPGGETRAPGRIELKVRVQCTDWIDIDRVQVLVNGRPRADLNYTRATHPDWFAEGGPVQFERTLPITLGEDSHLIVVAYGQNADLSTGYGSSAQASLRPCAYNNPIFVDVDGGGFRPSGDLLGWSLPVKGLTVDEVKAMLSGRGL